MSEMKQTVGEAKTTDLLTDQDKDIFDIIMYAIVCETVCLFGIVGNVINIVIFYRQGFAFTVNISFFGLAVSDLCCLITQIGFSIFSYPVMETADIPFIPLDIKYFVAGLPSVCFSRITSWITVYITAERCVSIAAPLKVKQIITADRTALIISMIYFLNFLAYAPEYFNFYLDWTFYPKINRTKIGLVRRNLRVGLDRIMFISTSLTGFLPLVLVVIFSSILVVKLGEISKWRQTVTLANEQAESSSARDKNTVKMIVLIASVLIVCYIPGVALTLTTVIVPEFTLHGNYTNAFISIWSFGLFAQQVNSSVNIILYYKMSTKFRQTFYELFQRRDVI